MTRTTKVGLLVFTIIVLGGVFALAIMLGHGFSARDEPTAVEAFIARRLRHLAVPRAARTMENPVPPTEDVLVEARAHFADHCALCHGNDGSGQTQIGQKSIT